MRTIYLLAIGSFALSAGSALAGEPAFESNLKRHQLSASEIAEKCKASIKAKVDLVTVLNEHGKSERVPRCVMLYRTASQSANDYLEEAKAAIAEVGADKINCDENATQQGCLDAGKRLIEKAASTHAHLATKAEEIETKLEELDLPEAEPQENQSAVEPDSRGTQVAGLEK